MMHAEIEWQKPDGSWSMVIRGTADDLPERAAVDLANPLRPAADQARVDSRLVAAAVQSALAEGRLVVPE